MDQNILIAAARHCANATTYGRCIEECPIFAATGRDGPDDLECCDLLLRRLADALENK